MAREVRHASRVGHVLRWEGGKGVVERRHGPGNFVEVNRGGQRVFSGLYRLDLDRESPLTPRTSVSLRLPGPGKDDLVELKLGGVWWCQRLSSPEPVYLVVDDSSMRVAKHKAHAYCALGAVECLRELGLEDAAISLTTGDFDHASVQVIQERERRKKE